VKPSPQPRPNPKTLADLLANAEHYARFCMANSGRVTPALFFLAPEGQPFCDRANLCIAL
jgi:hypothetical protein